MEQIQGVVSVAGEKRILSEEECGFWEAAWDDGICVQEPKQTDDKACVWQHGAEDGVCLQFAAKSRNESFARMVAAAYAAQLNPTLEELSDIKTAVSEAVTNAVIHGYGEGDGTICMRLGIYGREVWIEVEDRGAGMEDVLAAMEPMYTTRADMERSGMGFAFMEAFMDKLEVYSQKNRGTLVRMKKKVLAGSAETGEDAGGAKACEAGKDGKEDKSSEEK